MSKFKVRDDGFTEGLLLETQATIVHVILNCVTEGCRWSTEDYEKGDEQAAEHVRETGHTVEGEYGLSVMFQGVPA